MLFLGRCFRVKRNPGRIAAGVALVAMGILVFSGLQASARSAAADFTVIPLKFPELRITESDGLSILEMEGCPVSRDIGAPVLPVKPITMAAPPGKQISGVSVVGGRWKKIPGTHTVQWGQPPAPSTGEPPERVARDRGIYGSNNPYPGNQAAVKSTGFMRKVAIGSVAVNPVRYFPESGVVEACSEMTVKVCYESIALPPSMRKVDRSPASATDIVDNAEQSDEWYGDPAPSADTVDYVIITTEALTSAVTPIKTYKESQGLAVNITTVEWIYANCPGGDNPARIRGFLKDRYLSWGIDYVLLVGDDSSVPMRRAYCPVDYEEYHQYIPTDYYYSDLSGNWDLDGDGKYGENGVDDLSGGVDFYPEVMVGRVPSSDFASVRGILDKIVGFSTDSSSWKNRVLLPCAISNFEEPAKGYAPTWGSPLGEQIKNDIATPEGFSTWTMYERAGVEPDPVPGDQALDNGNFINQLNNTGYGVVTWWGHGNYQGAFRAYKSDPDNVANEPFVGNTDSFSNDRPAIVFQNSCLNGEPEHVDNLSTTMLNTGAVATVGGTRVTWYSVGWEDPGSGGNATLAYCWTKQLVAGGHRVGKAIRMADLQYKNEYLSESVYDYANIYAFNLFGEPSMKLSADGNPTVTGVSPDSTENTGTANLTVNGTNFLDGVAVKLTRTGYPDVNATSVSADSPVKSTCSVNVEDVAYGQWNVVVTNPDGRSAVLEDGFALCNPTPTVSGITPSTGTIGGTVRVSDLAGAGFRSTATVQLRKSGRTPVSATNVNRVSSTRITCDFDLAGTVAGDWDVFVENGGGKNATKTNAFSIDWPAPATTSTWYLAEGTSDWGFDTYVTIQNPNNAVVTARVTYMTGTGQVRRPDIPLPAMSQTVINPRNDLGEADFSTKVECREGKPIAVDRRMTWTGGSAAPGTGVGQEGHASVGVNTPAVNWYLPEGSASWGFECWLLIQNPNDSEATCEVTYMIEDVGPRTVTRRVPAESRRSYNMADDLAGVRIKDASIRVASDRPVIAERAMYRDNRRGGHCSIGTTAPATEYYLAEGTTDWGFTTYVLIQNPGDQAAVVNISYLTGSGSVPHPANPVSIPGNSRKTIRVNDFLPGSDFSTRVSSDKPVIAERAMYWSTVTGEACHDSIGMDRPHATFYLPDGETYGGMETWTLVANPNQVPVTVEITYMTPTGKGNMRFTDTVPANSRRSYSMGERVASGRAAVMVTSKTAGRKIMVERAMYWNDRGSGTDTIGGCAE